MDNKTGHYAGIQNSQEQLYLDTQANFNLTMQEIPVECLSSTLKNHITMTHYPYDMEINLHWMFDILSSSFTFLLVVLQTPKPTVTANIYIILNCFPDGP